GSCRGAQPHDGTCSSAVRPYCLRSKTWGSLRPHVHLCNNATQVPSAPVAIVKPRGRARGTRAGGARPAGTRLRRSAQAAEEILAVQGLSDFDRSASRTG
ncbi:MAG: hypothetical protein VB125_01025, partial [Burkholderia sp.]